MHKTVKSAFGLFVFLLPIALANGQSQQNQLIGRWRSLAVSPAGLSTVFDFHGDNQFDSFSASISDEKYRLVGTDTILIQSTNGPEEKQELDWENEDRARIEDEAAGKSIELARVGKSLDSKNPLAGEWNTTRDWNDRKYPARALFSTSKIVWIVNVREEHGHYSSNSKTVHLEMPGRPVVDSTFTITGDRLILTNPRGSESIFERF